MHTAPYASDPAASRGREFPEERAGSRGPRSEFQRDRDRIVHSIAFRRLRSKTQVFIAPDGDHYRTRLTHNPYPQIVHGRIGPLIFPGL